jgi:hypothetical protein
MDTITGQAVMTAHTYLFDAIKSIDRAFGEGYAKDHPELVSRYVYTNVCPRSYDGTSGMELTELGRSIESGCNEVATKLPDDDHP